MKYYLAVLQNRFGEYEVDATIRFATKGNPTRYHDYLAKTFWVGECDKGSYDDYDFGHVAVTVGARVEVTKEVFDAIPNSIAPLLERETKWTKSSTPM